MKKHRHLPQYITCIIFVLLIFLLMAGHRSPRGLPRKSLRAWNALDSYSAEITLSASDEIAVANSIDADGSVNAKTYSSSFHIDGSYDVDLRHERSYAHLTVEKNNGISQKSSSEELSAYAAGDNVYKKIPDAPYLKFPGATSPFSVTGLLNAVRSGEQKAELAKNRSSVNGEDCYELQMTLVGDQLSDFLEENRAYLFPGATTETVDSLSVTLHLNTKSGLPIQCILDLTELAQEAIDASGEVADALPGKEQNGTTTIDITKTGNAEISVSDYTLCINFGDFDEAEVKWPEEVALSKDAEEGDVLCDTYLDFLIQRLQLLHITPVSLASSVMEQLQVQNSVSLTASMGVTGSAKAYGFSVPVTMEILASGERKILTGTVMSQFVGSINVHSNFLEERIPFTISINGTEMEIRLDENSPDTYTISENDALVGTRIYEQIQADAFDDITITENADDTSYVLAFTMQGDDIWEFLEDLTGGMLNLDDSEEMAGNTSAEDDSSSLMAVAQVPVELTIDEETRLPLELKMNCDRMADALMEELFGAEIRASGYSLTADSAQIIIGYDTFH